MNNLNETEFQELQFKLEIILYFLITRNGYSFKLYNHTLSANNTPNSNIVEYCEDVINLIDKLKG